MICNRLLGFPDLFTLDDVLLIVTHVSLVELVNVFLSVFLPARPVCFMFMSCTNRVLVLGLMLGSGLEL